jgi:hypothetical protein
MYKELRPTGDKYFNFTLMQKAFRSTEAIERGCRKMALLRIRRFSKIFT